MVSLNKQSDDQSSNFISVLALLENGVSSVSYSNITFCKYTDNSCFLKSANDALKTRYNGIPEIDLVPFDPLFAKKLLITQGAADRPIRLDLEVRDFQILGLKNGKFYKLSGFTENPEGNKLDLRIKIPLLTLVGPYTGNGKILIFPGEFLV